MSVTWEILIPTIPHRHAKLVSLLAALDAQMTPEVRVTVWRDNLESTYCQKLQGLMDSATAPYVSTLADDDMVSPDFISSVLEAMASEADYIGFRVRYVFDGVVMTPVVHSLDCGEWRNTPDVILRDLMYYNPIRREHAQRVKFRGVECDREWANDLREIGCVQTETFIDAEMLYYQVSSGDNFYVRREPYPDSWVSPLPSYPWLTIMEAQ